MKIWLLAVLSIIVGVGGALASVWIEFETVPSQFAPHNQTIGRPVSVAGPRDGKHPPVATIIGGLEHDFKNGQRGSTMKHTFVIRNDGDEPLTLETGATSCKCTLSELEQGTLQHGETANIELEWHLITPGKFFHQTAEIVTNDPVHPLVILSVNGKVIDLIRLNPEDLVLSSVSANEGTTTTFQILGFTTDDLRVESYDFDDMASAAYFSLQFEPLAKDEFSEKDATCGLLATLTVKPGLPLGPIKQTIRLRTDVEEAGTVELPITGHLVSDISIVGPSYFKEKLNLLSFGALESSQGAKATLRLLIKGPHRHDVRLTLKSVDPEGVLLVQLGEIKPLGNGVVYTVPVTIEVAKDARPVDNMKVGNR